MQPHPDIPPDQGCPTRALIAGQIEGVTASGFSTQPTANEYEAMCLGIPMQIVAIEGDSARCQVGGVEREVSLFLLKGTELVVGDFVMVHVGYAIQKVGREEARSAWELVDRLRESGGA